MRQIQLSQNQIALLDDEDFDRFSQFHYCYRAERGGRQGYAIRHVKEGKKYKNVYLHRDVAGPVPAGYEVIFRNGDRLDCRRENLLVVSKRDAIRHHQRARSDSQSGIKGLHFNPRPGTWSVDVYRNGTVKRVGTFFTRQEALDAYNHVLQRENPDLHTAPALIDRRVQPETANGSPGCRAGTGG